MAKKVKKRVKGWLETEVWNPVRKYVAAIVGGLVGLIIIIIVIKLLHKSKITKICKSSKKSTKEDPKQVYIIRRPLKPESSESNPESIV